jgi:hypothetical protein
VSRSEGQLKIKQPLWLQQTLGCAVYTAEQQDFGVGWVWWGGGGIISAVVLEVQCSHYVTGCEAWWACGGVSGSAPHGGGRKGLE